MPASLPADNPWEEAIAEASAPSPLAHVMQAHALARAGSAQACLDFCKAHPESLTASRFNPLDAALASGRFGLAFDLIRIGADAPREAASDPSLADLIIQRCSCPSLLAQASQAIEASGRAAPSWNQWISLAMRHGCFVLGADIAHAHGGSPSDQDISLLEGHFVQTLLARHTPTQAAVAPKHLGHPNDPQAAALSRLLDLWGKPLSERFIQALWTRACHDDSMSLAGWLASRELFPSKWTALPGCLSSGDMGESEDLCLVALATTHSGSKIFRTLLQDPRAVACAAALPPTPLFCSRLSTRDLVSLHARGVDVLGVDEQGRNVLHCWAEADGDTPREGWRSIAKLKPQLLEQLDAQGRSPVDIQTQALAHQPKRREGFAKMIAGIESSQLQNSSAAPSAPTARPRL